MSMTREEAKTILFNAINTLWEHDSVHYADDIPGIHLALRSKALSILAPSPRKEPPTVEEVGDGYGEGNEAWVYDNYTQMWILRRGAWIRGCWGVTFNRWLPYSALPKGGA